MSDRIILILTKTLLFYQVICDTINVFVILHSRHKLVGCCMFQQYIYYTHCTFNYIPRFCKNMIAIHLEHTYRRSLAIDLACSPAFHLNRAMWWYTKYDSRYRALVVIILYFTCHIFWTLKRSQFVKTVGACMTQNTYRQGNVVMVCNK